MLSGAAAALYDRKLSSGLELSNEVVSKWKEVKEGAGANWVTVTYDASGRSIVLKATGDGGYSELVAALSDAEIVYGACAFWDGGRRKCFFITVIGEGVPAMRKARVSLHKQGVYNAFEGVVASVSAADKDELKEEAVLDKLKKDTGSSAVSLVAP